MSGAIAATSIAVAGSIGGGLIGAHAAGKAADAQSSAADRAANLQHQDSQQALAFQKEQYYQGQQNLAPWLQSGRSALGNLDYLLGNGPQGGFPAQPGTTDGIPGAPPAFGTGPMQPSQITGGITPPGTRPALPSGGPMPGATAHTPPVSSFNGALPAPGAPAGSGLNTSLGGFGSLMQPYQGHFTAPTNLTEQNDPGFQARLALGTDAIQRSAAARGGVLTGGTAKALDQFGQDYASNEYGNVYNRAFNQFTQDYNQYNQGQTNEFNRLASLAGVGQQTAEQLGMLGNQAAQGISNNLLSTGAQMGQDYQNAGAANASGYVGAANAWQGALGGASGGLQNLLLLRQLQGGSGRGGGKPLTIGGNGSITDYGY